MREVKSRSTTADVCFRVQDEKSYMKTMPTCRGSGQCCLARSNQASAVGSSHRSSSEDTTPSRCKRRLLHICCAGSIHWYVVRLLTNSKILNSSADKVKTKACKRRETLLYNINYQIKATSMRQPRFFFFKCCKFVWPVVWSCCHSHSQCNVCIINYKASSNARICASKSSSSSPRGRSTSSKSLG